MDTVQDDGATSFAAYLAKHYVAKKGYAVNALPEVAGLAGSCDTVLTLNDGYSLKIVCIIDRESNPGRRFDVPLSHLQLIGEQCLPYTGKINGKKMPIYIHIMEVGGGPLADEDRTRLSPLKSGGAYAKVQISAWHLDPTNATLWTNAYLGGLFLGARGLRRLMAAPRLSAEELQPVNLALQQPITPWATYALLAILGLVFVGEQLFGIGPSSGLFKPTIGTLMALGGTNSELVFKGGEWYRLLTAPMLHGDALHLLMNAVALYIGGNLLERLIGRAWFLALFVIGGIGGSAMSLAINPANMISVGASGAIMALLAAAFVCSYRLPPSSRVPTQVNLSQILIPALIPLATSAHGEQIDFAGHFGGAVTGALVGWALWRFWPATQALPSFRRAASSLAVLGMIGVIASFALVARGHQAYALSAQLIPPSELPKTVADERARAKDLVARYPHDPRAHLAMAGAYLDAKDYKQAELELQAALQERNMLNTLFAPELEWQLRTNLAQLIAHRGATLEAKTVALPVCVAPKASPMKETLRQIQLCQ